MEVQVLPRAPASWKTGWAGAHGDGDFEAGDGKEFLPVEGDTLFPMFLSWAFLMAADDRTSDPTIVSQTRW
ncbi:MAG: hypothetical protein ACKVYV_13395 [Limisphaerales bacterium]